MNFFEHSLSLLSIAVLKHLWAMNRKYSTGPKKKFEFLLARVGRPRFFVERGRIYV